MKNALFIALMLGFTSLIVACSDEDNTSDDDGMPWKNDNNLPSLHRLVSRTGHRGVYCNHGRTGWRRSPLSQVRDESSLHTHF